MLKWDSTRARVLQGAFPELLRALKDPKATVDTVSACALAVTRAVQEGGGRKHMRRKDELAREYWADFEARCANQETFPYGYAEIDTHLVEGSMPGKCAVFAGLSGSGKSTFCAAMAIRLAKLGRRVAYGAFEMGSKSTMDVMISNITGIPIKAIVQGRMSPEDRARVRKAIIWITNNIRFMNNPSFDASIRGKKRDNDRSLDVFEGYLAEAGCDVIFCDLWERLLSDLSYDGMTQALYRQQDMFARYNIFGIIVQQLRGKDVEKRSDKRPTRESIKGTGAFVEVADQIFGIHREAQFKKVPDDSIELVCLKQRKGEANWAVAYDWDGATSYIGGTGREVSFDPGLDDVGDIGGIDDIQTNRSKKRSGGRVRREDNVA
jgi:replicative DNA helicase